MISRDEFWIVLEGYGAAIAPVQFAFYFAALAAVGWMLLRPGNTASFILKLLLAISFAWTGVAFYLVLASGMAGTSRGNYVFGFLFLAVSFLFAVDLFRHRMQFSLPMDRRERTATLVLLVMVFCYPIFGLGAGHGPTAIIFPGTYPCPTVALALLILAMALPRVDKAIYYILLLCAIPFTPIQILRYGVLEDLILLASGIFALVMLLRSRRPALGTGS